MFVLKILLFVMFSTFRLFFGNLEEVALGGELLQEGHEKKVSIDSVLNVVWQLGEYISFFGVVYELVFVI